MPDAQNFAGLILRSHATGCTQWQPPVQLKANHLRIQDRKRLPGYCRFLLDSADVPGEHFEPFTIVVCESVPAWESGNA